MTGEVITCRCGSAVTLPEPKVGKWVNLGAELGVGWSSLADAGQGCLVPSCLRFQLIDTDYRTTAGQGVCPLNTQRCFPLTV